MDSVKWIFNIWGQVSCKTCLFLVTYIVVTAGLANMSIMIGIASPIGRQ